MRSRRIRILAVALVAAAGAVAAPASAKVFTYQATTAKTFAEPTAVRAGVFNWQCAQSTCTIKGPWAEPSVGQCKTLAKAVGTITAFGHDDATLDAAELAECNAGVTAAGQPPAP